MISLTSGQTAPSFDHPLEMLHACHGKILRLCDTLQKLAAHLPGNGCDQQARQAAQGILRYFDSAGKFHHQDEELDLFPALRLSANPDREKLEPLLERLLAEHAVMLAAWDTLRPVLLRLADGTDTALPESLTDEFIASHTRHIALEEAELLPLAACLLSPQQTMQIGRRMAERRGAQFTPPGNP